MKEAENKRRGTAYLPYFLCLQIVDPSPEKIEDAKARAAIKAQIEADKKARAEKAAREKAIREGRAYPESSTAQPAAAPKPSSPAAATGLAGRDYPQTRLQIRLASGGQPYTTTLSSDSSASISSEPAASCRSDCHQGGVMLTF